MRAIRLASAAALGIAALSLTAPTASADDRKAPAPVQGTVTPSTIAAGGQVRLAVTGCTGDATADSGVFNTTTIPMGMTKAATVFTDAKPGAVYTITFDCGGMTSTADLTIAGGAPTTSPTISPTISSTTIPTTTPTGPARGGLGGSVSGMDAKEIAVGAAMVAVAAGGTIYVVRRRSGSRQH